MRYFAQQLFDGESIQTNQIMTVEDGKIIAVTSGTKADSDKQLLGLVTPGFIDVQVNGGGGVLFNNQPNLEALQIMSKAHQQFGTTAMLPTLITDDLNTMLHAGDAIAQAITSKVHGIVGVHFEGPHLSQPKKGIHPEQHIRQISDQELALFTRKDLGVVCVTLAPENVSCDVIKHLVQAGVKVCLGHSNATVEQTQLAIQAGAQGFTHLFNAMSPLQSRAAGMVGAALLDDNTYCGLIVDHEHVDLASCQLAIKCKTANKIMLVTDAMSHVGSEQVKLQFSGMDITREGNKLTIEGGRLAGSALDMASAVRNTIQDLHCTIEDGINMASSTPANFIGKQQNKGKLAANFDADWLVLDDQFEVNQTYISGQKVF
ncbi:N-acetylglucosamine-6-phosphate deacetylase [Paraglaciecola aquimarina]|uniref:N-acetylgalactosamine-6-phosphate deacetylase n=1 Tax=Paraglaciecola algarum TaxID=3050085 RepID=A0ABS9D7N2_9ALTE|nr:N-acetylglucosamine-6-phosphate deacetylase [Paraglaciecola sp. G1-23]MCF2948935.1 N-acetylglucosamine-6-phosphate deacetylase [Paraglaciecola sp. G1-23]